MEKVQRIRMALRGIPHGPEREAEKLRLLEGGESKRLTEMRRRARIAFKNREEWTRKRHVRFHINFTAAEWLQLTAKAKARGGSIAALIRSRVLR